MKKKFTKLLLLIMSCLVQFAAAQQWSDVGIVGFTTSNQTLTNPQFAFKMAIYNNIPYVAFIKSTGDIDVMSYTAGTWTTLPSPATGTNNMFVQLEFDATGNLYLGYMGASANAFVKKYNGSTWTTVGTGAIVQDNLGGLAINPVNQEPYIAVYDGGGTSKASVYRFNGTSWVTVGPAQFSTTTQAVRLAISSAGVPYITLQDGISGSTFSVQKFDGTNWVSVGSPAVGNLIATATDIVVDASGAPYVFSVNPTNGNKANVLKYNGTAWVAVGQANFSAGAVAQPDLKFDNTGVLHLAYQDAASVNGANKATVMKFNGTSWVGVGDAGFSGAGVYYPSLAFNSSNQPYVCFRDAGTAGAKGSVMKLCSSSSASVSATTPGFTCGPGGVVAVSASGSGSFRWYNANGLFIAAGATYTFLSLTATTTIFVAAYDANGCSTARVPVTATVNTVPTVTSSTPASRCGNGTLSLSATPSAGAINWFAAPTGGSALGTGTSFTTPVITNTTTYYAEASNAGCASTARTAVVATVNPLPTLGVGIGAFRCGSGTVTLSTTAFPTGATVTWFAAPTGGSSIGAGETFTTPTISNTTTYYAEANFNGCVSASRQALVAEVRTIPTVTSSVGGETCNEGSISLGVTTSNGSQPRWYDVATGGTSLGSSTTFTTPTISTTTTYYVEAMQNGCASAPRTAVVATIKPLPTLSVSDVSRCDAGTVSFEAASTGTVSWFTTSTGGSALATGIIFTTPVISVTTPYFVEATLDGCSTLARTQVQAVVVATPAKPVITQNNTNIEAPVLTSSASSGNQWFKNDLELPGETGTSHTITSAGVYKVQVNTNGCPSPFSDNVIYVVTGTENLSHTVNVFPNPATDFLVVDLGGFNSGAPVNVSIVDFLGRSAFSASGIAGNEMKIDVRPFTPGQYALVLQQGKSRVVKLFLKTF